MYGETNFLRRAGPSKLARQIVRSPPGFRSDRLLMAVDEKPLNIGQAKSGEDTRTSIIFRSCLEIGEREDEKGKIIYVAPDGSEEYIVIDEVVTPTMKCPVISACRSATPACIF